jgi:hypothetical protein
VIGTVLSFIVSTLFRAAFTNGALADGNRPSISAGSTSSARSCALSACW